MRRLLLAVVLAVAVGCGKKDEPAATSDSASPPNAGGSKAGEPKGMGEKAAPNEVNGFPSAAEAPKQIVVRDGIEIRVAQAGLINKSSLLIVVKIGTRNGDKVLNFTGWSGLKNASLKDDKGNSYEPLRLNESVRQELAEGLAKAKGDDAGLGAGPVYSDRPRYDALAFDRPVASAGSIDLELSGAPIGWKEPIRFRIPSAEWKTGK